VVALTSALQGQQVNQQSHRLLLGLAEAGITLSCLAAMLGIGYFLADDDDPRPLRRRRRYAPEPERDDERETTLVEPETSQPPPPVQCPKCATALQLRAEHAGRKVRCPKCETVFIMPPAVSAAPAPSDAITERPARANPSRNSMRAGKDQAIRTTKNDERYPAP
jgi:hypothetical protein